MERPKTVDNLIIALLESWNDNNPKEKLNEELIDLISSGYNMAYVAGVDELSFVLLNKLQADESTCSQISKEYIKSIIMNHKP